jgi:formate dehydrogenase subunit beta
VPLRSRPCFLRSAEEAGRLVWDSFCGNNLAVYLPRFFPPQKPGRKDPVAPPKVAVAAKACDIRSIVGLVKEKQVPRENVVIIALPCPGMVDPAKVTALLDGDGVVSCEDASADKVHVKTMRGRDEDIPKQQVLADACLECSHPSVEGADVVIDGPSRQAAKGERAEERWKAFEEEMSKCIMCYACRQACPNCYCKVCFADQTRPAWVGRGNEISDVMLYHIGRIFHQAGRCVGCGACVRACPMNVDLRPFTEKIGKDTEELFGYTPGMSWDDPPPLCTFRESDPESFITEP